MFTERVVAVLAGAVLVIEIGLEVLEDKVKFF
jgi:hypothetical protein